MSKINKYNSTRWVGRAGGCFKVFGRKANNMLKILELNLDLEGLTKEETICLLARLGNRIYKKKTLDKYYKLWKKFKNATRAKKFLNKLELEIGLKYFGTPNHIYLSSRII